MNQNIALNEAENPQLTTEQQLELIKLFRKGDARAKRKMITHNMQLVVATIKHYANRGVTLLDLILHGNHGLIHALEKFELDGSVNFQTFAELCIRQSIERAVTNQYNTSYRCASRLPVVSSAAPSPTHANSSM